MELLQKFRTIKTLLCARHKSFDLVVSCRLVHSEEQDTIFPNHKGSFDGNVSSETTLRNLLLVKNGRIILKNTPKECGCHEKLLYLLPIMPISYNFK